MIHGEVVGELWSTIKVPSLTGLKMLIVRPAGDLFAGKVVVRPVADVVAVDIVGAGVGDRVIVALGKAARSALGQGEHVAVEAAIVGIVDDWRIKDPPAPEAYVAAPDPVATTSPFHEEADTARSTPTESAADVAADAASTAPEGEGKKKAPRARNARRTSGKMRALPPDDATGDLFADATPTVPAASEEPAPPVEKKGRGRKRTSSADDRRSDDQIDDATEIERDADDFDAEGRDAEPDVPGFADIDNVWQDDDLPSSGKDED